MVDAAHELAHPSGRGRSVAVTAACSSFGASLVAALEVDRTVGRIVALGRRQPTTGRAKTRHYELDLTLPGAEARVAEILQAEAVDTLVHLGSEERPTNDSAGPHALESLATSQLLAGARLHPLEQLLVGSQTWLYGADAHTPGLLDEDEPLRADEREPFFAEKIASERAVARFAREVRSATVTVLRTAPIVSEGSAAFATRFLEQAVVWQLLGFDPPWQLLDERDAVAAFCRALARPTPGIFNIVGRGTLPLSRVLSLAGRAPLHAPYGATLALWRLLWPAGWSAWPPSFLPYLRYGCVADATAAERLLGFRPEHSPEPALGALASARRTGRGLIAWTARPPARR